MFFDNFNKARKFFKEKTINIEIIYEKNTFYQYYPKLPQCTITKYQQEKFENRIERESTQTKLHYIQNHSYKIMIYLKHEQYLKETYPMIYKYFF